MHFLILHALTFVALHPHVHSINTFNSTLTVQVLVICKPIGTMEVDQVDHRNHFRWSIRSLPSSEHVSQAGEINLVLMLLK